MSEGPFEVEDQNDGQEYTGEDKMPDDLELFEPELIITSEDDDSVPTLVTSEDDPVEVITGEDE